MAPLFHYVQAVMHRAVFPSGDSGAAHGAHVALVMPTTTSSRANSGTVMRVAPGSVAGVTHDADATPSPHLRPQGPPAGGAAGGSPRGHVIVLDDDEVRGL